SRNLHTLLCLLAFKLYVPPLLLLSYLNTPPLHQVRCSRRRRTADI
ncbi:unnamed protein product, partial [Musa textilis]